MPMANQVTPRKPGGRRVTPSSAPGGGRLDPSQRDRAAGAQVVDDRRLGLAGGEEGLPRGQVLEPVEVAGRDHRKERARDPPEEVVSVEKLEAVERSGGPFGLHREARRARDDLRAASRVYGWAPISAAPVT